jgi:hypothetical protein
MPFTLHRLLISFRLAPASREETETLRDSPLDPDYVQATRITLYGISEKKVSITMTVG